MCPFLFSFILKVCSRRLFVCVLSCGSDFDKRVNDNKTTAEEALKRIPQINATINTANDKTRQAEEALGNAAADAKDAKSKAEEAEKIAGNVQKVWIHDSGFKSFLLICIHPINMIFLKNIPNYLFLGARFDQFSLIHDSVWQWFVIHDSS